MGDMLACLRGWHPGLAKAELAALMPDARLEMETSPRWVRVTAGATQNEAKPLASPVGCSAFSLDAVVSTTEDADLRLGWRAWPLP